MRSQIFGQLQYLTKTTHHILYQTTQYKHNYLTPLLLVKGMQAVKLCTNKILQFFTGHAG